MVVIGVSLVDTGMVVDMGEEACSVVLAEVSEERGRV